MHIAIGEANDADSFCWVWVCGGLLLKDITPHPEIELVGVYDNRPSRLANFSKFYSINTYSSFDSLIK